MTDFTVADVLAWARTKPARRTYDYICNDTCAIAQFLRETGRSKNPRVASDWNDDNGNSHEIDERLIDAANMDNPTFGKFVENLEALTESAQ